MTGTEHRTIRNGIRIVIAIIGAIHFAAATAWACPLCLGLTRLEPTMADEVGDARDVVEVNVTGKPDAFEIKSVMKGDAALNGNCVNAPDLKDTGPLILYRAVTNAPWKSLGASGVQVEAFIKLVLALPATPPASDQEWSERLARFRPYLGHPDLRLARSALTEWARAPYSVLTAQHVDGRKLGAWLMSPAQADAQEMMRVVRDVFGSTDDALQNEDHVKACPQPSGSAPQTP